MVTVSLASADQFQDDRRADETCSTRNKYSHCPIPLLCELAEHCDLPTLISGNWGLDELLGTKREAPGLTMYLGV
jgi:hypothetical protein